MTLRGARAHLRTRGHRLRFGAGRCRGFKHTADTPPYLHADVQGVQGENFVYVPMRKAGSSYITEVACTRVRVRVFRQPCINPELPEI
jgi:hypothetical protein